jgi:hypothetical protein
MTEGGAEAGIDEQQLLRLAKMLADPLRIDIHYQCKIGTISPRRFRQIAGGGPSLTKLQQAFEELEQFGWIERVLQDGGEPPDPLDRLYRSGEWVLVDDETWSRMPNSVRASMALRVIEGLSARAKEAMKAGTITAREDTHQSWTPLLVDRQGWDAVIARVNGLFDALFEELEAAEARLAESGEDPILMTVGLLAFESPRRSQ